jgi:hypothetical protein
VIADDIRQVVARRTPKPDNRTSVDELSGGEAKQLLLSMMTSAERARAELVAYLDELAELSARLGATNTERGAAVGISKQAAAKRWGDPRASRVAASQ